MTIDVNTGNATVHVGLERFGAKLDLAQDALDAQVWADMKMYMPLRTGNLIQQTEMLNASTRGEVYLYPPQSDYGHYMYEGWIYEDPVYHVGGFFSEDYGWWSRPGVQKVKSDRPLMYGRDTAEAHWDEVAAQNHRADWLRLARRVIR